MIAGGNEDAGTGCVEGAGSFYTDPRGATGYEDGLVRPGIGEGVGGDDLEGGGAGVAWAIR